MHIFVIKFQSKKPLSSVYNQSATTITFLKSLKVSSWQGWVGKAKKSTYTRSNTRGPPSPNTYFQQNHDFFFVLAELTQVYLYSLIIYIFLPIFIFLLVKVCLIFTCC